MDAPMSLAEAERLAARLVGLGYSARATLRHHIFGYIVIVSGRHGSGPRFRYVITAADQFDRALADLARSETGGSNRLMEGI